MECRCLRKAVLGRLFPAFSGLCLAAGCTTLPQNSPPDAPPIITAVKDQKELPPRTPQAATCVAFANVNAGAANNPDLSVEKQAASREEARKSYQRALTIDPSCADAYFGLARLYRDAGRHDQAVALYRGGLEKQPRAAAVWYELGMYQARHQEWEPAIESLRKALDLDSENSSYVASLGFTLAHAGRDQESFEVFRKAGGAAQAHYKVARMLHHVNQDERGKEHLRLALQERPDYPEAKVLLDELEHAPAGGGKHVASVGFEGLDDTAVPGLKGAAN